LVHSDFFAAGMMLLALYACWRFMKFGGWKRGLLAAAVVGFAQIAKYTMLLLYPILLAVIAARYLPEMVCLARRRNFRLLNEKTGVFLACAAFSLIFGIVFVSAGFVFQGCGKKWGEYAFRSEAFREYDRSHPGLRDLPFPLPYPYLQGIDWQQWRTETGKEFGYMYLFGKTKKIGGFRNYFLYAFLFKVPIAFQALCLLAAVNYAARSKRFRFRENEAFLVIPIAFFALYVHFRITMQIGIRYLLPIFPIACVFCGSFFREWPTFRRPLKILVLCLFAYLAVSVFSYYPHFLSYFNEFVGDRTQAYKILADSNLDWGQGEWYLARYLEKHPEAVVNPPYPRPGLLIVGVNELTGVWGPEKYRWLRENYEPVGQIAHCYLIYDIPSGE
jgi:hypothetical protein